MATIPPSKLGDDSLVLVLVSTARAPLSWYLHQGFLGTNTKPPGNPPGVEDELAK
jgi:hypothetical protein